MKDKRNPSKWSNTEIAADTEGYLEAQRNYRADRAEEERKRREADALERFTAQFVANGGNESDAAGAFWSQRNEDAAAAAQRANTAAAQAGRRRVRQVL